MAIDVIVKFLQNSTVWIRAYIFDSAGDAVDPTTSTKVTIADSTGTKQVDAVNMTKDSTGVYDYFYDTDADSAEGSWSGEVWVVDGAGEEARTSVGTFAFQVKKGL